MKQNKHTRRLLSTLLALCMVISMFSGLTLMAGAVGETWEKVDLADIAPNDIIVVVATLSNGSTVAMSNDNGTGAAPAVVPVTVEGNVISSKVPENIKWNITGENNSYTFYPNGNTDTWLYCTSTNNGVRVGTNANKAFTLQTTTGQTTTGYLVNTATNRYMGVYNTQDWRCYTSINTNIQNQTFAFYKLVGGEEPTGYSVEYFCNPEEAGMITASGAVTGLNTGDTVTLTATANPGYEFVGWSVAGADVTDDMANPIEITVGIGDIIAEALFTAKTYTVTVDETENGKITADPTGNVETGTVVAVMAEAAEGYYLQEWYYMTESDTEFYNLSGVDDGITTFIMPADNVTISATFAQVVNHAVYFYVGNDLLTEASVRDGKTYGTDLPVPTAPEGYAFMGWTADTEVNPDGTGINYFDADTPVSDDLLLSAVFARVTQGGGSGDYVKVTENLDDWSGEYAIVCEASSRILDGTLTKDETLKSVVVEISDNKISESQVGSNSVTVAPAGNDTYSIRTQAGYYIGRTANGTGLDCSTEEAYKNTISINKATGDAVITATAGSYLRFNDASNQLRFRYYTGNSVKAVQLYKKDGSGVAYSDYTLNPVVVPVGEHSDNNNDGWCDDCGQIMGAYLVGRSITLGGNIGVNYYMEISEEIVDAYLEGTADYYMNFVVADKTTVVSLEDATVDADGRYCFTCEVTASQMSETITATFHKEIAGELWGNDNSKTDYSYSVVEYALDIMEGEGTNPEYTEQLTNLVKAMLYYGGNAQKYFNYNTGDCADEYLDGYTPVTVTADDLSSYKIMREGAVSGLSYYGASLVLKSETSLRVYFQLEAGAAVDDYLFTVGNEVVVPVMKGENFCYVEIPNLGAGKLGDVFNVSVWGDDGEIDVIYGPLSYAYSALSSGRGTELQNVVTGLYNYYLAFRTWNEAL